MQQAQLDLSSSAGGARNRSEDLCDFLRVQCRQFHTRISFGHICLVAKSEHRYSSLSSFAYGFGELLLGFPSSVPVFQCSQCYTMSSHPATTSTTISFKTLQQHDSSDNCWIAVHSKIYDVTDFLDAHPGGSSSLCRPFFLMAVLAV